VGNSGPGIWVVRAGSGGSRAQEFEQLAIASIGYGDVGDIRGLDRPAVLELMRETHPDESDGTLTSYTSQVFRFANEIELGDWVLTPDGGTRELLIGRVAGDYEYQPEPAIPGFHHVRRMEWQTRRTRDLLPRRVLYSLGALFTVFRPNGREHLLAFIEGRELPDETATLTSSSGDGDSESDLFEDVLSRSEELIQAKVAQLDGYETQHLVAGVLRAMGYFTRVSPEGPDGGVDIVASRDPLAVEPPVIKVQVKARPSSRSSPSDIRELAGVLREGERGIFVSTGGFTRDAQADAAAGRVTLIDIDRLQELLVEYYDELDQDTKSLVPLRRLYFP
jgi:restriction system protein